MTCLSGPGKYNSQITSLLLGQEKWFTNEEGWIGTRLEGLRMEGLGEEEKERATYSEKVAYIQGGFTG